MGISKGKKKERFLEVGTAHLRRLTCLGSCEYQNLDS